MTRSDLLRLVDTELDALTPGRLTQVARAFGPWSVWILCPAALRRLDELFGNSHRMDLAEATGEGRTAILFVLLAEVPLLRQAIALPVVWRRAGAADDGLVLPFGDRVSRSLDVPGWRLCAPEGVSKEAVELLTDASLVRWESGWVPAAIALLDVADTLEAPLRCLATGEWSPESGVLPVKGIPQKVELAVELGAERLLVPELNREEAERKRAELGAELKIVSLSCRHRDLREVLRACKDLFPPAPRADAPPQEHQKYFDRLISSGQYEKARAYYQRVVMPRVAAALREQWLQQTGQQSADTLVTIASGNAASAFYSVVATQPDRVLLLYTQNMRQKAEEIRDLVARFSRGLIARSPRWVFCEFDSPDRLVEAQQGLRDQWLSNVPEGQVVVDLTPGTKEMTIEMYVSVRRPGDRAVYIRHRSKEGMAVPFTEKLVVYG